MKITTGTYTGDGVDGPPPSEDPNSTARGIMRGALYGSIVWLVIGAIAVALLCNPTASAQAPPLGVTVYTSAQVDALLAPIRADIAALKAAASATPTQPPPTQTATNTPSQTPTTPPSASRPRGLSYATDWDVSAGDTNAARNVGASIIKISASFPHRRTSDLSASELNRLAASLNTVRAAGMHAIVRFSYWYHWDGVPLSERIDAQPAQAHRHVDQLAAVINANGDVVLAVEAGIVGKWGEWHYHEVTGPMTYGERSLSNSATGARANLVRKLLDTYQVPVLFRYPRDIRWMWGFLNDSQKARVGMHNDAVLTTSVAGGEWGTWESGVVNGETDEQWLRRVFLSTPRIVGGEFAESTDLNDAQMVSAFQALAWRQYSFHSWDSGVPWGQDQFNPTSGIKAQIQRLGLWDDLVRGLENGW